ncbi:MAG TPA: hypothetical protein VF665_13890 [Longimicrobium sp.]|jgi:hypothetical protein|uniref:hypothetical protein n=1 Tax=Longimicrobium sp. TaxID=2029185 RepID=UPI002ED8C9FD
MSEHTSITTIRLQTPDPSFRLTAQDRARIRPGYDVDALERLLAAVIPPVRAGLLSSFTMPEHPAQRVGVTVQMGDPALQPLLDEVWAPMWELYPDMLDTETKDYPGREIARQRRARKQESERPL